MDEIVNFRLPSVIMELVEARNRVREHYDIPGVTFTFDGKLVGDIGEVVAAKLFGITLTPGGGTGVDGYVEHLGRRQTVQVKATNKGGGPAFRRIDIKADFLIFLDFQFDCLMGRVLFNGPEHIAIQDLPTGEWKRDQMTVARTKIKRFNAQVEPHQRLPIVDHTLLLDAPPSD